MEMHRRRLGIDRNVLAKLSKTTASYELYDMAVELFEAKLHH